MAKRLITIVTTSLALLASTAALAGTAYTKIANNGTALADSALLGTGPTDWACTRDNVLGLVWEVKTSDTPAGLRDMANTYTNLDDATQLQKWSGTYFTWVNPTQTEIDAGTNSIGFATAVNAVSLCSYSVWRMPSRDELLGIVLGNSVQKIDTAFFPNTPISLFWSGSPYDSASGYAWSVSLGNADVAQRGGTSSAVRLVSGGQTFALTVTATGSGAGSVTAAGINCAGVSNVTSGICFLQYVGATAQTVTLTASPASNSVFTGWGGACSGTSTCTVTKDASNSVSARFTALSGIVMAIVIDPTTPSTLYAALDGAGVYASTDSSANWTLISKDGLTNLSVRALAIQGSNTLFAATYDGGVFKGSLSGSTWTWAACGSGLSTATRLRSLIMDASGNLYAGGESGVYKGSSACTAWAGMNTGLLLPYPIY